MAYREEGYFEKAISGLKEILLIFPNDLLTVKELTEIYVQINDNQSGLEFFESMMNTMIQEDMLPTFSPFDDCEVVGHYSMGIIAPINSCNIGFEEVNTLVDLYISLSDFHKAADAIILWVQKLKGIQFLDILRIDEDFDNEADIPIELRVKLGICRMNQGSVDTAKVF